MGIPDDVRAKDEAFWAKQEARRDKQFGQPCCTQSGMSWTMIDMPGDFALVIHGEFDCVNCFHHHMGRSAHRYYSTRLSEAQLTTGDTESTLSELLHLIAEHERPEAVIVLGTCPVEVIGAQYVETVERAAEATGVPMLALRTSGLALTSMRAMLDWLYVSLAKLPPGPPVDLMWHREVARLAWQAAFVDEAAPAGRADRVDALRARTAPAPAEGVRVNLFGLPADRGRVPEPLAVLHHAGVAVNGVYPEGASLASWRAIHHATHTVVVDRAMVPKLIGRLARGGQAIVEAPPPVGLASSVAFYKAIGEAVGASEAVMAAIDPLVAQWSPRLARVRAAARGLRLGYALRMNNSYQLDALTLGGLGEVLAYRELGFDVHLYIQGGRESAVVEAHADSLAKHGVDIPFTTFNGPYEIIDRLVADRVDLAVVEDTVYDAARRAGLVVVEARTLAPYLSGVRDNLAHVRQVLDAARGRRA